MEKALGCGGRQQLAFPTAWINAALHCHLLARFLFFPVVGCHVLKSNYSNCSQTERYSGFKITPWPRWIILQQLLPISKVEDCKRSEEEKKRSCPFFTLHTNEKTKVIFLLLTKPCFKELHKHPFPHLSSHRRRIISFIYDFSLAVHNLFSICNTLRSQQVVICKTDSRRWI